MAGRSRSSFTKRQKERSRQEKQREKAEKKVQRRSGKPDGPEDGSGVSNDSFDDDVDYAAVADQLALPGSNIEE
jgi:hypothetical protein